VEGSSKSQGTVEYEARRLMSGQRPHSETGANVLIVLAPKSANFSEQALIQQVNYSVLETGALAIELHSYAAVHMPSDRAQSKALKTEPSFFSPHLAEISRHCQ
jgi:hypothetical protein